MNKLITKARSGVTLVELLVVILIVTILSVAMLPLLQPFVTEAQYAAEAIPVIGNIRTKVGVYVYDKGHLPYPSAASSTLNPTNHYVETWSKKTKGLGSGITANDDVYAPAYYSFGASAGSVKEMEPAEYGDHINNMLDIDYQDLKGKRSKPLHYQYLTLNPETSSYVIGCFGDGNGLKAGTGYAVCELNFPKQGRKMIGTWKRYKSYTDDAGAIVFTSNNKADATFGKVLDCYVPEESKLTKVKNASEVDDIVGAMEAAGWEF